MTWLLTGYEWLTWAVVGTCIAYGALEGARSLQEAWHAACFRRRVRSLLKFRCWTRDYLGRRTRAWDHERHECARKAPCECDFNPAIRSFRVRRLR